MLKSLKRNVLLALVVGVIAFTGCQKKEAASAGGGAKEAAPQVSGKIEVWSMLTQKERADEFQRLADNYMASHPGTTVNVTVMPWSGALDKEVAAIMAGNAPDIMITGTGYPQTLAGTQGLHELSKLVEQVGGKDAFLSTSLSVQGAFEKGLYSIPLYITPYVAYYRKSWLAEAGITKVPETWEEYYQMCKAVTDPAKNRYGFAIPLGDLHSWKTIWTFLQANDVDLINVKNGDEWYIDLPPAKRAAMVETYEYLYKLIKDCAPAGTINYTQSNVREMIAGGTVMSRVDTPELYYTLRNIAPDDMTDVEYFRPPKRARTGSGQGWVGLSLSAKGNIPLAEDFIKYMFTGDTLVDFFLSYPYAMFPAKAELFANKDYQNGLPDILKPMVPDMALDILSTSSGLGFVNGPFPAAGELESQCILGNGLIKMFSDGYSAEAAVDYIVGELQKLL